MSKESSSVDTPNVEMAMAALDDGPLPAYPCMAGEPQVDEMMRGYRDMAYALVALALQEDTPDAIRANPTLAWWVGEVLEMDMGALLTGMRRRTSKARFPRLRIETDDTYEREEDDDAE